MTMPGTPATPPAPPAPTPDPTTPPAPPAPDKSFTQDDVNRLLAAEKRRLLAEQPDLTELRTKASKFDELEAANKTELEKERTARDLAEKKAADADARVNAALIRSAVVAAASKSNVVDVDLVFAALDKSTLTVATDGTVTGIDDALKAFLADKPFLVGTKSTTPGGDAGGGARGSAVPGQLTRADLAGMKPEAIEAARVAGRLNNIMGIA